MKPGKMKAYASFAAWKRDQSAKNQRVITALTGLVRQAAPGFTPTVKWGQGCWTLGDDPKIYFHAEPDHVQFGFYAGSTLKDPHRVLAGSGKFVRHVKVSAATGIPREALVALVAQTRPPRPRQR
jgi:hypothetical protein